MTTAIIRDEERMELKGEALAIEGHLNDLILISSAAVGDGRPASQLFAEVEEKSLRLSERLPYGSSSSHDALQLLLQLHTLRAAIAEEGSTIIEGGRAELEAVKALEITRRMERRLDQAILEDSDEAAKFIFGATNSWATADQAKLLGVSSKTIGKWKKGGPVKQNASRVRLAAHLTYYLRPGHTEIGLWFWFNNPASQLDGRTPLQVINGEGKPAEVQLIAYARGGRGQLG